MFSRLIILLLLISSCAGHKQNRAGEKYRSNYFSGYIISVYGDTLHGRIKSQESYDKKISFIPEGKNNPVQVRASDVRSMKINILQFEKIVVRGKEHLYEKVAWGYYSLFAYHYQRGEVSEDIYYLQTPTGVVRVSEDNFREIASVYLFDYPLLREKILTSELGYRNILDVFRLYNSWKSQNGTAP